MPAKDNIPDGYNMWAQRYFGEVIGAVLEEVAVGVAVEESLKSANEEDEQRLTEALETSEKEAEETENAHLNEALDKSEKEAEEMDEANLKEAMRQSEEQKKTEDKARIELNKKSMQSAVDVAKTITPVTPKFAGLIDTFTKAQLAFDTEEQKQNYEDALKEQGPLKNAAEALAKVKGEHEEEVNAWAEIENWRKADGVKVKEALKLSSLPTALQQPQSDLNSAYSTFNASEEQSKYVEAKGLLGAVGEKLIAFQGEQAKQEQLKLEVEKKYAGLKGLSEALALKDLNGDPLALHGELVKADSAYQGQFTKAEYGQAEGLLGPLGDELKKFQTAKEEQDKDKETIEQNNKGMKAAVDTAKTLTPITPKFAGLVKTFTEAQSVFVEAEKLKNYKDMIKAQEPLKKAAEALAGLKDEHDNEVKAWATIEGWKKTNDATLQTVAAYEQATPEVRAQMRQLRPLKLQFETQVDAQSYVAAAAVLPKLEQVVKALHGLKGDYDKAMIERNKVDLARKALKDRYDKANGTMALTENVMKLKETLKKEEASFDRHYNGGDYAKALEQVKNVEVAVKAVLDAQNENEAARLLALKAQKELSKYLDKLDKVKAIPQTLSEIKPLQDAIDPLTTEYGKLFTARKYDEAFNKAVELGTKVEALQNLKAAAEQKLVIKKKVNGLYNGLSADLKNARKLKGVTPELKTALEKMEEANGKFFEFYKPLNYEEAQKRIPALKDAIQKVLEYESGGKKKEYDEAGVAKSAALKAYDDIKNDYAKVLSISPYPPKLDKLCKAVEDNYNDFKSKYDALNFTDAKAAAEKLGQAILALEAERSEYEKEHKAKQEACLKEWKDHVQTPYGEVEDFEPLTQELKGHLDKLPGEFNAFKDAYDKGRYAEALEAVGKLRLTVEELKKLEGEHKSTGEGVMQACENDMTKKGGLGGKLKGVQKIKPDTAELKDLFSQMGPATQALEDAENNDRPGEFKTAYDKVGETVTKIFAAQKANKVAEKAYAQEWKAIYDDYVTVYNFEEDVLPEIDEQLKKLKPLKDAHRTPAKAGDYVEARAQFPAFKKLVEDLLKREADYNQAEVEHNDCEGEESKLDPDLDEALTVRKGAGAVTPGMVDAVDKFEVEWKKYLKLFWAGKYTEAKQLLAADGALDKAAKELAKKKTEENYDTVAPEKEAVDKEWKDHVNDNFKKVKKFKPFTPEFKTLLKNLDAAESAYDTAYEKFKFTEALPMLKAGGAFFDAIQALLDKEGDQTNEASAADLAATNAASAIDTKTDEDLKKLSATDQLDLLKKLRGRQVKLTDAERASQRKLYNAMKLDDKFVQEDDRKCEELIKMLRPDPKLKEAQEKWNGKPPLSTEKRVEALQELVKKQCAVFGMDVPEIKTFSDLGDLEGHSDSGYFSSSTGNIYINVDPNSTFGDFAETLDTIAHENAHNYQAELMRRLNAEPPEIGPSDPEYTQALLFAANDEPGGYVTSAEQRKANPEKKGINTYKKQPMEEHAWKTGPSVSAGFLAPEPVKETK